MVEGVDPFPAAAAARPYIWAQLVAGLEVLPETPEAAKLQASSHLVLKLIRARVTTHLLLTKQLTSLGAKCILVHPSEASFPPLTNLNPTLEAWSESGDSDLFKGLEGRFFVATFQGPAVKYEVHVFLSPAYPEVPPQFVVKKQGDVEAKGRLGEGGDTGPWALSHQLRRLQGSLDACA
jgi:hypothetical protein